MSYPQSKTDTDFIKFVVPTKLKEEAISLAKERHISLSAMMRLMLTEYLKSKS